MAVPRLLAVSLLLAPLVLTGCVKKSTHQATVMDLERARQAHEEYQAEMAAELARREAAAERAARERAAEEARLRAEIERLEREVARLDRLYTQSESRFDEARREIDRLETLLNQRGSEFQALQRRLQSLSAIEREARERNQIYQEVVERFRSLIQGGQLSVAVVRGRLVIQLPQDILFESGSATLGRDGQQTLAQVAAVLSELPDRRFQVEGHTDNVPIATQRFPSNWELSAARSLAVVRLMVDRGVRPENISGAAYGEFQPVASNDDRDARRRNRRIEIVMLPNLDVVAGVLPPEPVR